MHNNYTERNVAGNELRDDYVRILKPKGNKNSIENVY